MVNLIANICFPCGNKYFQQKAIVNWKWEKKIRIVSEHATLTDTIIPALEEWLPKGRWTSRKASKPYESKWETDTGWEISLMSYDQDPAQFESATLGLVVFDEPPPESIYIASVARLRLGGLCLIFATPLTGSAWMYDTIVANVDAESKFRFHMTAEVEDACIEHGGRGFLHHEDIVRMVSQYSPEDRQARVFGKFQHLIGLVFKKFDRKIHVIPPFHINKQDFTVIKSWDTHARSPEALSYVAIDRKNRYFVCDEIYSSASTSQIVSEIYSKEDRYRIEKSTIDPSAGIVDKRMDNDNSFVQELIDKYGLYFEPGSKRRTTGIKLIEQALNYTIAGNQFILEPNLFVFNTCMRHIWEFEHWQWDEWKGKTRDNKNESEKPKDKDDHMLEALGRNLLTGQKFIEANQHKTRNNYEYDENLGDDPYDDMSD